MEKKVIHGKLNVGSPCVLFGEGAGNPKRSGCSALLWMKMIFVVIAAAASVCSAESFGRDSGTTYMKDALAPYVEKGELPGAVCILYNNGVVETTCIGYADVAAKRPITVNDVFAQCSQTKGFCGVTVAMLVKTGAIDYETKSPVDAGTYRQELSLERGELKDLVVTPAARRADVVFANQRW